MRQLQACPDRLFQFRLAKELGQPDVDRMIDDMSREQLEEWKAVAVIDGWANGWQQTAELMAAIQNSATNTQIMLSADSKAAAKDAKFVSGHEIATRLTTFGKQKKKSEYSTPEQAQQILAARYGHKNRSHSGVQTTG